MTHTPGPWKMNNERNPDGSRNIKYVGKTGQFVVATNHSTVANAALIASAPDLLEALKMVVNIATHPKATKTEIAGIAKEARAAIAKAEGRE